MVHVLLKCFFIFSLAHVVQHAYGFRKAPTESGSRAPTETLGGTPISQVESSLAEATGKASHRWPSLPSMPKLPSVPSLPSLPGFRRRRSTTTTPPPEEEEEEEVPDEQDTFVVVREPFMTDNDEPVTVEAGQRGLIFEVDDDGDWNIHFLGFNSTHWVLTANQSKLELQETVVPGTELVVREGFETNSNETKSVVAGQRARIMEVDEEGDWLIQFEGIWEPQWVIGSAEGENQFKLDVTNESDDDVVKSSEEHSLLTVDMKTNTEATIRKTRKHQQAPV